MKKGMVKLVLMLVLSCLMVLPATASPQPEEETQFNGEQIYEGEDSRFRGRPNWFDYTVVVPTNRIVPLVVRELDIKPAYEFFADIVTKRAGNQDPIVARPIMNLDVFGKLALGYESEENVRFDNPVRVELTTGFIKARTEFDTVTGTYFVFGGVAYTPEEFAELGKITDLDTSKGLAFYIVDWPVDDLMLIGGGH